MNSKEQKSLNSNNDIIKMETDIVLTDKYGSIIKVEVPSPEYMVRI